MVGSAVAREVSASARVTRSRWGWAGGLVTGAAVAMAVAQPGSALSAQPNCNDWSQLAVSTSPTTDIPRVIVEQIKDQFVIAEPRHVESFIRLNPFVGPLLLQVDAAVGRYFGQGTPVRLEVIRDADAGSDELFAFIETNLEPELAMRCLREFDMEWWLEHAPMGRSKLIVSLY